jgi:hypothetical protein
MIYRPHDGTRVIQKLGGQGLLTSTSPSPLLQDYSRETTPRDGPIVTHSAPSTPATGASKALGIAQVNLRSATNPRGDTKTDARTLEPKHSILSMWSLFGGSENTRESQRITPPSGVNSTTGTSSAGNANAMGTSESAKYRALGMSRKDSGISPPPSVGHPTETGGRKSAKKSFFFGSSRTLDDNVNSSSEGTGSGPNKIDHSESAELFAGLSKSASSAVGGGDRTSGSMKKQRAAQGALNHSNGVSSSQSTGESAIYPSEAAAPISAAQLILRPALRMRDTRFLFDLAVAATDKECGGGREGRRTHWSELRADGSALGTALAFLQNIAEGILHQRGTPTDHAFPHEVTDASRLGGAGSSLATLSMHSAYSSTLSGTDQKLRRPNTGTGRYGHEALVLGEIEGSSTSSSSSFVALSASMSNMLGLFSSTDSAEHTLRGAANAGAGDADQESRHAPQSVVPLTLLCSRTAAAIPWEALLLQSQAQSGSVVRHMALVALCAQAYTPVSVTTGQYSPSRSKGTTTATALCTVGPQWVSAVCMFGSFRVHHIGLFSLHRSMQLQQGSLVAMCPNTKTPLLRDTPVDTILAGEHLQRATTAKAAIAALNHTTAHLHTRSNADDPPAALHKSLSFTQCGMEGLDAKLLPSTVPLAIDGSTNSM